MLRPTHAKIHLGNLRENLRVLRARLSSDAWVIPMVKADAYGHGAIRVARELRREKTRHLGVALIEEGIELRQAGDSEPILVFNHFTDPASAEAAIEHRLEIVCGSVAQLESLYQAARRRGQDLRVHCEFDTGMNRLGFHLGEISGLESWLGEHPGVRVLSISTHLAAADDPDVYATQVQAIESVRRLPAFAQIPVHVLNSAGLMLKVHTEFGGRPGIALYGIPPKGPAVKVAPVLEWRSQIILIRNVKSGERVSYNGTWTAKRDSQIGVIACGYGDGYRRNLSNKSQVIVRGSRIPQVGTICMDYMMIDLTDLQKTAGKVEAGEPAVLVGAGLSADELADLSGTIPYEILTGISARVPRIYVDESVGVEA